MAFSTQKTACLFKKWIVTLVFDKTLQKLAKINKNHNIDPCLPVLCAVQCQSPINTCRFVKSHNFAPGCELVGL
jgi:hypothetical protein